MRRAAILFKAVGICCILFALSCKKGIIDKTQLSAEITSAGHLNSSTTESNAIRIFNFNILAPCWADPVYYPPATAPFLDRVNRRKAIIELLRSYQATTDVITLQEVAQAEFYYLEEALKATHIGFQANHASAYWSNWTTPSTPWEPNGNAVFINKERFSAIAFEDLPASASGNHAALFTGVIKNSGGRLLRVASIHLDSDHAFNRKRELEAVLEKWVPENNAIDIISGDFNTETKATNIQLDIRKAGYVDLLNFLGKARQTHPWNTTYYRSDNWGIIDHIIYRNGTPFDGAVLDFDLFNLFPKDETMRINRNLQLSGSDHFPVIGSIGY